MVDEGPPPLDLDHGQPLAVSRLQGGVAGDVDLDEAVAELGLQPAQGGERPLAEVAARRVVDGDERPPFPGQG